jgi:hypothetical protein
MKKVLLWVVAVVCVGSYAFAQSSQSLQLAASSTQRAIISAPASLAAGTTIFTLDSVSSIIVTDNNINRYAWLLGGNTFAGAPTNNYLGTTTATDLRFITGTGGPNVRMTISGTTGGVTINGDLDAINGATGYNWPTTHAPGYLQNNGTGGLSWQSSLQASRAGLGNYFTNNYGTGVLAMPVSGTTILTAIVSPFGGGLSGVSILVTPPGGNVGGSLVATVTKNGVATGLTVTLLGGAGFFAFTDFTATPVAFNAGDQIGVSVTDGANTFAPNVDILVTVFANF